MNRIVNHETPIGVVGLGAMGWGLATRLRDTANLVAVYDQADEMKDKASAAGMPFSSSLAELAQASTVVIMMLPSPTIFAAVASGPGGLQENLREGSTIVDMATDGPEPVLAAAQVLAPHGIRVLDAAVGRGPAEAASGQLIIMAGGEEQDIHELRWLYEQLGSEVHHCGPVGAGQSAKLVNNLVQCANAAVLAEACALGRATGVSDEAIRNILPKTAAASFQLDNIVLRRLPKNDLTPGFKVELAAKDVRLAISAGHLRGVTMGCATEVLDLYDRHVAAGNGSLDQAVIVADSSLITHTATSNA